jgi:hypothetical protein
LSVGISKTALPPFHFSIPAVVFSNCFQGGKMKCLILTLLTGILSLLILGANALSDESSTADKKRYYVFTDSVIEDIQAIQRTSDYRSFERLDMLLSVLRKLIPEGRMESVSSGAKRAVFSMETSHDRGWMHINLYDPDTYYGRLDFSGSWKTFVKFGVETQYNVYDENNRLLRDQTTHEHNWVEEILLSENLFSVTIQRDKAGRLYSRKSYQDIGPKEVELRFTIDPETQVTEMLTITNLYPGPLNDESFDIMIPREFTVRGNVGFRGELPEETIRVE